MDGPEALARLAQKVRARLEVTEAEMDRLGVLLDSKPGPLLIPRTRDIYNALTVRFDALTEVLGIIEGERRGQ